MYVSVSLHIVVMIAGIHIPIKIFAIDMLTALKPSLEHDRKYVSQLLRPGLRVNKTSDVGCKVSILQLEI